MTTIFGKYIRQKLIEKDIKETTIACKTGMSRGYVCDIIHGRRYPPDVHKLELIAEVLSLNYSERMEMFDLAGRERNQIAPDLTEYIMDENLQDLRSVLRKARDKKLDNNFWKLINLMIDKNKYDFVM